MFSEEVYFILVVDILGFVHSKISVTYEEENCNFSSLLDTSLTRIPDGTLKCNTYSMTLCTFIHHIGLKINLVPKQQHVNGILVVGD